ncbi:hypothetical protein B0H11DRAFT_1904802 [Mycena galericulata]|nr:hypothetical protein B0H11DRAFT_1904802 [Mycena galericulata]
MGPVLNSNLISPLGQLPHKQHRHFHAPEGVFDWGDPSTWPAPGPWAPEGTGIPFENDACLLPDDSKWVMEYARRLQCSEWQVRSKPVSGPASRTISERGLGQSNQNRLNFCFPKFEVLWRRFRGIDGKSTPPNARIESMDSDIYVVYGPHHSI